MLGWQAGPFSGSRDEPTPLCLRLMPALPLHPPARPCCSWNGERPVRLADGSERRYLADGDTVVISGHCQGEGYRVGFGECRGTVLPALQP